VKGAPPILLPYHQVWLRFPRGLPNDQQEHFRLLPPCPTYLLSLRSTPRSVHSLIVLFCASRYLLHGDFAAEELQEWLVDNGRVRLTRGRGGLVYATVEGAGHMVGVTS
jgi:hypothetical protein